MKSEIKRELFFILSSSLILYPYYYSIKKEKGKQKSFSLAKVG
jgi:hypothetical protein